MVGIGVLLPACIGLMFHVKHQTRFFCHTPATGPCENRAPPPMISLQRYAALFAEPDLRAAILASLLGRLPIGISGLALLLLVQAREASFTDAGLVTSAYLAGLAGIAPLVGRPYALDDYRTGFAAALNTGAHQAVKTVFAIQPK